jgi:hypothetical protein
MYAARDILEELASLDFSISTGYLIARMVRAINVELPIAEEKRISLIRKYGNPDPKNKDNYLIKPEHQAEAGRQLNELMKLEVPLECDPIKISVLDGERAITNDRLIAVLIEVREGKRTPAEVIPEIRALSFRLNPIKISRIAKFLEQD